jgi:hypothetical protein
VAAQGPGNGCDAVCRCCSYCLHWCYILDCSLDLAHSLGRGRDILRMAISWLSLKMANWVQLPVVWIDHGICKLNAIYQFPLRNTLWLLKDPGSHGTCNILLTTLASRTTVIWWN